MFDPYSEITKIQAEAARIQAEERVRDAQLQRERDALFEENKRREMDRLQSMSL